MSTLDLNSLSREELQKLIAEATKVDENKAKQEKATAIAAALKLIEENKLTVTDLFPNLNYPSSNSAVAKPKVEKEDGKLRRPSAICYNSQAVKGEQVYTGRAKKPSWLTDENKSKFAVLDIAEQIKILREHGHEDLVVKREQWLAANPTETRSKE